MKFVEYFVFKSNIIRKTNKSLINISIETRIH